MPDEATALIPLRLYDNSRLSDYKKCPRYFLLRHCYNWTPTRKRLPLIFGSSWHAAMDVIWRNYAAPKQQFERVIAEAYAAFIATWQENGMPHPDELSPDEIDEYTPRIPQIAEEMLYNYIEARQYIFKDPTFKLIDVEQPFAVPLDPDNESLWYVGRLDKVFELRNKVLFGEHKTTTSYRKSPTVPFRSEYLDSFSLSSQIDGYLYKQLMEYGDKAGGVYVDAALVHKTVHDGFTIIPIDKKFAQIEAWLWTAHQWIADIERNKAVLIERSALDLNYLAAFPQNTGSCGNFAGCDFADICRGVANPAKLEEVPMGFKIEHWSPFDAMKLEAIGFTPDRAGEPPRLKEHLISEG
jgi:hypothetical protein